MPRSAVLHKVSDSMSGFTLIEMMVVLAIIGLVLGLIVPNIGRGAGHYALVATARDIAATLRLTRERAISTNRPIRFVAATDTFGSSEDKKLRHVPWGIALTISDRVQLGSGNSTDRIQFFPDGSSSGGAVEVIDGAARYAVVVDWISGNVSIEPRSSTARR